MGGVSLRWLLFTLYISKSLGFIWKIDSTYPEGEYKYTFSELYMYSTNDAPLGIVTHPAMIDLDLSIKLDPRYTANGTIVAAIFHVPTRIVGDPVDTNKLNLLLTDMATNAEVSSPD